MVLRPRAAGIIKRSVCQTRIGIRTAAALAPPTRTALKQPSISDFAEVCSADVQASSYPLAQTITSSVPIYDGPRILQHTAPDSILDEWYRCLLSGPGVFVIKQMYTDHALLNVCNDVFDRIIADERASTERKPGDHFSTGENSRIWNSFQKHGSRDPSSFCAYYSNSLLHLACSAWLGPGYRITAQVNIVRPGGKAQVPHRDYHLGFQTDRTTAKYPLSMQVASQLLTLQGAVAHTDMPIESGPTQLLPFSQRYEQGYLAYRLKEFQDFFDGRFVQVPLEKGDGIFFNPSLFHAAGANKTKDFDRSANLLQVSSAFGKAMEAVNTPTLIISCWDVMKAKWDSGARDEVRRFVRAVGEGYSFPTNLDRVPPKADDMAPESEQDLCLRGLQEGWDVQQIVRAMSERAEVTAP